MNAMNTMSTAGTTVIALMPWSAPARRSNTRASCRSARISCDVQHALISNAPRFNTEVVSRGRLIIIDLG
jgi:hypothetical protein